jgi:hypothetical protein
MRFLEVRLLSTWPKATKIFFLTMARIMTARDEDTIINDPDKQPEKAADFHQ